MDELIVVGLSHRTAPLALRERVMIAFEQDERRWQPLGSKDVGELVWLATCNRLEAHASSGAPEVATEVLKQLFFQWLPGELLPEHLYSYQGVEATQHLFSVAASLDSMVLGEPQILGQVKRAYAQAQARQALHSLLGRCSQRAFALAKRVRNETSIAEGLVSISSVACDLAQKIFGDLADKEVLLVGAGKMGEASARQLVARGAKLSVVNRSPERAQSMARSLNVQAKPWSQLAAALTESDVVITSTASSSFIIDEKLMRQVVRQRRHRPLFLVDIAVPRNVDPQVAEQDNVFLYDIDDMQQVAEEHRERRKAAAESALALVQTEVNAFEHWRTSLALTNTILALRDQTKSMVEQELSRWLAKKNLKPEDLKDMEGISEQITNKILHQPLTELKRGFTGEQKKDFLLIVHRLFGLDIDLATEHDESNT